MTNDEQKVWEKIGNYTVLKGSNDCIAMDATPSKECDEYHKRSKLQINFQNNSFIDKPKP